MLARTHPELLGEEPMRAKVKDGREAEAMDPMDGDEGPEERDDGMDDEMPPAAAAGIMLAPAPKP